MSELFVTGLVLIGIIFSFLLLYQLSRKQRIQLSARVLVGLALGVAYGVVIKHSPDTTVLNTCKDILYFVGHGYLAVLKMLVIPLILTSIIHAIVNIGTTSDDSLKKISILTCLMLLGMTALASLIGLVVGDFFAVGYGFVLPEELITPKHTYHGLIDTLLAMLPSNPVAVMAQENTIAVVIFAVFVGIAARMLDEADHEKMETFRKLISSLFAIVKKLAALVLMFTPYGVFAMMALLIHDQGWTIFNGMLNFIAAMYAAMLIVIIMHLIILAFAGYHPLRYFKNAYMPLLVAFTTRSSFGTLPVTEETLRQKFNTKQIIATFVPSLGATMGMNACAGIFPAMLVVTVMNILHQPLTWELSLMVMFINAIASLGVSGIPGTAYIAASVTLTSLHLPYAVVGLVQGIDPIIDMGRTATNVNGVLTTALVVNHAKAVE